jgi:NitT/TauT family transport system substrate-binding protein
VSAEKDSGGWNGARVPGQAGRPRMVAVTGPAGAGGFRHAARVMLAAAMLVTLVGCGSGPGSPAPAGTGPEQPDITVAAIRSVTTAGLYLAAQHGYFTAAGLRVKIVSVVGSQAALPELVNNRVQVVFGNYIADMLAQAAGTARLRFLAAGNVSGPREQEVVVLPDSPISSPAGLRGKTIGVNSLDDAGVVMIESILSRYDVPGSAVHFVDIPFPDEAAALAAHRIDAAYITEPFLTAARQKQGVRTLFDCDQGAVANFPIAGYVATSAWATKDPRTVSAFVSALEKGQALADSDRAAVNAVLVAHIGIAAKTAAAASIGTFPVGMRVQSAPLQRLANLLLTFGLLKRHFDVAAMLG